MSEKGKVVVAGEEFNVIKTGRDQASQVLAIAKWIKDHGADSLGSMANEEGEIKTEGGASFISNLVEGLTVDALIELYVIVLGCSKKFANEHFDIAVLIESLVLIYEEQPSFRRLFERFFSTSTLESDTEESSTKSEENTDGQTK